MRIAAAVARTSADMNDKPRIFISPVSFGNERPIGASVVGQLFRRP
jgi:hypothetical protein